MNQPWNVIKASSIASVALDCDLSTGTKIGGGTATDNTAALNAFLATASATNPIKLILDGPSLVTGLVIATAGYTEIEGIGWTSGIWIKSGSNADPINNGKILPFDPQTAPPASGEYVRLANFMVNGNRGNGTTGDSTSGQPQGIAGTYWYCNINLCNLNGVRIEDMFLYDAPAYSIRLNNCSDAVVQNCRIVNPNVTTTSNNDCVHVDGPATDIRILGNYLYNNNSDDAIAINAPEGYSGPITRVVISGNTFQSTATAARIYGQSTPLNAPVQQVIFANNNGYVRNNVITFGGGAVTPQDISGQALSITGNVFNVANGPFITIASDLGNLNVSNCIWNSPEAAAIQGFLVCSGTAISLSSVTVQNCHIYRSTAGNATNTPLLIQNGGSTTIKRLTVDGFQVIDEAGQSYAAITAALQMTSISITELYVSLLDYTNIALLADSYTNIASITGVWQPESNIQSKTGAYTLLPTDRTVLASTTAGSFAVALPAKSYAGEKHTIKNTGTANTLTITGTVDGSANPTLTTLAKMTVEYDGTSWWTV